jgi:hypothetical protein
LAAIPLPFDIPPLYDLLLLFLLLIVGIVVIILIAKVILFILPAGIIALVVWFLTNSFFWAGVAFLVVAFISLIRR